MCSITEATPAPVTVPVLTVLVEHLDEAARAVTAALASDPALLAEVPDELLERFALVLHAAHDATGAVATLVTGRVEQGIGGVRGKLIAGRYPSTRRFLEDAVGLSPAAASAMVARGRDLTSHSTAVADAWVAGEITGGMVRELTAGVTEVLRRCDRTDTPLARKEALDLLMPVARTGKVRRVQDVVARLKLTIDPDGGTEDALHAYERQSLSIVETGTMTRVSGWVEPETGAALLTVLEQRARIIAREENGPLTHDPDCATAGVSTGTGTGTGIGPGAEQEDEVECSCGAEDRARRAAGLGKDHLLARALHETVTDLLDNGQVGSHHRIAPHLTVIADVTDATAPLIGALTMPGRDHDVLLPEATVRRLMCDCDVTRVVTTLVTRPAKSCDGAAGGDGFEPAIVDSLRVEARSVLYVGRAERTVPPRLRRALEVRDQRCAFPGCHAHVRRCHAHHVVPWEDGGPTELPNTALLCVAHHHAVHEGGWTMTLKYGFTGHERDCWDVTPPHRPTRPW
jgi:hypothetical protein